MTFCSDQQRLLLEPYQCLSETSAHPCEIDPHALINEIDRECQKRRGFYPKQVEKRKMSEATATHEIQIMRAILDDLTAGKSVESRFTWAEKVKGLRREINFRRAVYPKLIEQGKADAETAQRQLERIEAVHFSYWVKCHFTPFETDLLTGEPLEQEQWRDQITAHLRCFDPADQRGNLDPVFLVRHQGETRSTERNAA